MVRVHLSPGVRVAKQTCKTPPKYKNIITSECSPDYSSIYLGLGLLYAVTQAVTQQEQFHILNCKINSKGTKFDVARLLATFSDDNPPIV